MKIVRRAATEERTGEVREMRMRKEPENAGGAHGVSFHYFIKPNLGPGRRGRRSREDRIRTCIRQDGDGHHAGLLAAREPKFFKPCVVEEGNRDPEYQHCEEPDAGSEGVGKDHASSRTASLGRTGKFLIQDFVEAIQDAANPDDRVSQRSVVRFMRRRRVFPACASAALGAVFRRLWTTIGDDEDADDGDGYREHFVDVEFLV